jgi:hypothetical protein
MKFFAVVVLALSFLICTHGVGRAMDEYEKGQLIGNLGFGAMLLDAYYEICLANGYRTDNYLNGVNKLISKKIGVSFSEMAKEQEKQTGRNFRQEAHTMIKNAASELEGCKSVKMNNWLKLMEDEYHKNLSTFHKIK